jgi:DNA invertase Pin-like site-specific DNA recombinase
MLKDAQRRRFDVVMALDRLGRPLIDLLGTIQALESCGVDLYLDQQAIDTTTPAGRLMFQITGAFAEFERSARAALAIPITSPPSVSFDHGRAPATFPLP